MKRTIQAQTKYLQQSPDKVRLTVNLIKGLSLTEALKYLGISTRKAASPLRKTIASALANAENNLGVEQTNLKFKEISIGRGPILRRPNYRARGRLDILRKKSSNITVILEEIEEQKKPTKPLKKGGRKAASK